MNRSSNSSFVTPALKVTTDPSTNETIVTSPVAPGKEWRAEVDEVAVLRARTELETMFKNGTLGAKPKWVEEFGAREKGSNWNE